MLAELRRTVWKIPKGKVATYGSVAKAAGFEGRARQVAWALHDCQDNLPWHRVVGAGGRILLRGANAAEQALRLRQEGVRIDGGRVPMATYEYRFPGTRKSKAG
jgi:methylated-DNA-protein-cysteine methyltransferase related protein